LKVRELGRFIRDQRHTARLSLRRLSTLAGVSNPYLSQIERGLRRPSAEILQAIAKALRISAEQLYVKAGILEERSEDSDLVGQILRDRAINERQKSILVELYQGFRGQNASAARVASRGPKAPRRSKAAPKPRAAAGRSAVRGRPASRTRKSTVRRAV
jgi:transcriptional regulator with XRE-family HTH domain